MALEHAPLVRVRLELGGHDSYGDAGGAVHAARPVGHGLAAPKADSAERVVQFARMLAAQLREHLPLRLARQIGAGGGAGHEETGKAERCAQRDSKGSGVEGWFMRLGGADEKGGLTQNPRR